jgi:formylglycine-generating enzyme required for sulfatase activity
MADVRGLLASLVLAGAAHVAYATEPATLPGGTYASVLPQADGGTDVVVAPFALDRTPVTNAQFLAFVRDHPAWRRDRVVRLFADERYLSHWAAADALGENVRPEQPVTLVSWFAAKAYCEARGARLPYWREWEYAAAADERVPDARADPTWRQRILDWYAQPASLALSDVGRTAPNWYGVSDLHGLIWEWVLDYNALLVSDDSREQGGADTALYCGAGAVDAADREQYAVLMRIAYLSSLQATYTTSSLGFRCAEDIP